MRTTTADLATAVANAGTAADNLTAAVADIQSLRDAVKDKTDLWNTQEDEAERLQGLVGDKENELAEAKAATMAATIACEVTAYDSWRATFKSEMEYHVADLETISNMLGANFDALPAIGAVGARCEKAISNGTWRPRAARGRESPCDEGLCCGAA